MLCVSIVGPKLNDIEWQIALSNQADVLELRFDLFKDVTVDTLSPILKKQQKKLLFTFKQDRQIQEFVDLKPLYVDLDASLFDHWHLIIRKKLPLAKLICSQHFSHFSQAVDISKTLLKKPADYIKIASYTTNCLEPFFLKDLSKDPKFIPVSLGSDGQIMRLLAKKMQVPFVYAAAKKDYEAAPGQVPIDELIHLYGLDQQTIHSKVYGLIGDPVEQSVGHLFHNQYFRSKKWDCVYVKCRLTQEDLAIFFQKYANSFSGLSVTMPLKQAVCSFVQQMTQEAKQIQAINTLVKHKGQWIGSNTDGIGAIEALSNKIEINKKTMLIFGTGATARAIAYEAQKNKVEVCITGRDFGKTKQLALEFGMQACSLDRIETFLERKELIFVQASSISMQQGSLPFALTKFRKDCVIFDVATQFSSLLQWAKANNRIFVTGKEMYICQAIEQQKIWQSYASFD